MVLYQAIRKNPHLHAIQSFWQHTLERRVVFRLLKDRRTRIRTIENVKHHSAIVGSFGSSHDGRSLPARDTGCQTKVPDTFSCS